MSKITWEYLSDLIHRPMRNVVEQGTHKTWNNQIPSVYNHWFHITDDQLKICKDIHSLVHIGFIIKDDLDDGSDLRDGLPAAHIVYGVNQADNGAIYSILLSLKKILVEYESIDFFLRIVDDMISLVVFTHLEIYWREEFIIPPMVDYPAATLGKGSYCPVLIIRLAQQFSDNKINLRVLADFISEYVQSRDDTFVLWSNSYCESKGEVGDDIVEGKMSLPIMYALNYGPKEIVDELKDLLKLRPTDTKTKNYIIGLIEKTGAKEFCEKVLMQLEKSIIDEIEHLGGNPRFLKWLEIFKSWEPTYFSTKMEKKCCYDDIKNHEKFENNVNMNETVSILSITDK